MQGEPVRIFLAPFFPLLPPASLISALRPPSFFLSMQRKRIHGEISLLFFSPLYSIAPLSFPRFADGGEKKISTGPRLFFSPYHLLPHRLTPPLSPSPRGAIKVRRRCALFLPFLPPPLLDVVPDFFANRLREKVDEIEDCVLAHLFLSSPSLQSLVFCLPPLGKAAKQESGRGSFSFFPPPPSDFFSLSSWEEKRIKARRPPPFFPLSLQDLFFLPFHLKIKTDSSPPSSLLSFRFRSAANFSSLFLTTARDKEQEDRVRHGHVSFPPFFFFPSSSSPKLFLAIFFPFRKMAGERELEGGWKRRRSMPLPPLFLFGTARRPSTPPPFSSPTRNICMDGIMWRGGSRFLFPSPPSPFSSLLFDAGKSPPPPILFLHH